MTHGKKPGMVLLDSNIVIYLRDPRWGRGIASQLSDERLHTCNVIIAEVLGFNGLETTEAYYFERLFLTMKNHPFNDSVTKKVIELRRIMRIQMPDAIIAATALQNNLVLWTHNTSDFKDIPNLGLFDPLSV